MMRNALINWWMDKSSYYQQMHQIMKELVKGSQNNSSNGNRRPTESAARIARCHWIADLSNPCLLVFWNWSRRKRIDKRKWKQAIPEAFTKKQNKNLQGSDAWIGAVDTFPVSARIWTNPTWRFYAPVIHENPNSNICIKLCEIF